MSQSLPGLYHTQGDRVVTALMKLYLKIQQVDQAYLEAVKAESESKSDDQKTKSSLHESLEVAQARCHLLEQQLRHVRSLLASSENAGINKSLETTDAQTVTTHSEPVTCLSAGDNQNSPYVFLRDTTSPTNSNGPTAFEQLRDFKKMRDSRHRSNSKRNVGSSSVQSSTSNIRPSTRKRAKSLNDITGAARSKPKSIIHNHYHLQLSDIPFVLGTATSASHSIIANIQNFIAMLKQHNPKICSSVNNQNLGVPRTPASFQCSVSPTRHATVDIASLIIELRDLIHGLEIEHDIISDEKNKLVQLLHRADLSESDLKTKRDLEALMIRLSVKEEQISRLRTIQILLEENQRSHSQSSAGNSVCFRGRNGSEKGIRMTKDTSRISGNRRRLLNELRHLQRTLKEEQMQWK